jgi:hypothetical protein
MYNIILLGRRKEFRFHAKPNMYTAKPNGTGSEDFEADTNSGRRRVGVKLPPKYHKIFL